MKKDKKISVEELEANRILREERLRALGFEEVSESARKRNLANIIALLDWQK